MIGRYYTISINVFFTIFGHIWNTFLSERPGYTVINFGIIQTLRSRGLNDTWCTYRNSCKSVESKIDCWSNCPGWYNIIIICKSHHRDGHDNDSEFPKGRYTRTCWSGRYTLIDLKSGVHKLYYRKEWVDKKIRYSIWPPFNKHYC